MSNGGLSDPLSRAYGITPAGYCRKCGAPMSHGMKSKWGCSRCGGHGAAVERRVRVDIGEALPNHGLEVHRFPCGHAWAMLIPADRCPFGCP